MLYLADTTDSLIYKQNRADSLSLLRVIARTPNNPDTLSKFIPSSEVIYMPAAIQELHTMDTPMFAQPENEVIALFNEWGSLIVKFNHPLDTDELKQYNYGVAAAVRGIVRADHYYWYGDTAELMIIMKPDQAKRAFDIRRDVQSYTESFLARLAPKQHQVSLF